MEPLTIVVSFDIGEQLSFRRFPRGKTGLVHEFGFQSAEAAFHRCVVPTISLPAHGLDHPGCVVNLAVTRSGIAAPALSPSLAFMRTTGRPSMRHQAANRVCRKQVPGHSAKDPFAKAAVSVSTGHNQIGAFVLCELDQLRRT